MGGPGDPIAHHRQINVVAQEPKGATHATGNVELPRSESAPELLHRSVQLVLDLHLHGLRQAKLHDGAGTLAYTTNGCGAMHASTKHLRTSKEVVSVRELWVEDVHERQLLLQTAHLRTQNLLHAAFLHAAPNVHQELLELNLDSCEFLPLHLREFVHVSEEKSESASVRVKSLHKSRNHREETPQEFPAQRLEGDDTDQYVEQEAVATIGHDLEHVAMSISVPRVSSQPRDTRHSNTGWRGGKRVNRPRW